MSTTASWRVVISTVDNLETQLNTLAGEGYEVFSIIPMGIPDPLSNIPRDMKPIGERMTVTVIARRGP
jgi:hypothetical protein